MAASSWLPLHTWVSCDADTSGTPGRLRTVEFLGAPTQVSMRRGRGTLVFVVTLGGVGGACPRVRALSGVSGPSWRSR